MVGHLGPICYGLIKFKLSAQISKLNGESSWRYRYCALFKITDSCPNKFKKKSHQLSSWKVGHVYNFIWVPNVHFRISKQLNLRITDIKTVIKIGLVGHLNTVTWEFLESGHTLSRFIVPFQFYLYSLYYSIDHTPKSIKISDHN